MMLEESSKLLAAYPQLHMLFGIAVAAVTVYFMVTAERGRRSLPPPSPPQAQMYFDGPIKVALDTLGRIELILVRWEEERRVDREIDERLRPDDAASAKARWSDLFTLGREIKTALGDLRPRR